MKIKIIMLVSLSIILLIISYLYYEKLSLFNNKYQILENKVASLEKYYNYSFFTDNNRDELNEIKNILNNNLQNSKKIEKTIYRLTNLENNIKSVLIKAIKNEYFQIIPKRVLLSNKYQKLKLKAKSQKQYNKIINKILKDKNFILKSNITLYSLDKLFIKYQIVGTYKINYLIYLNEDKLNNLRLIKKQKLKSNNYIVEENKYLMSKKIINSSRLKSISKNNNCSGIIYSSKNEADSKQKEFLNKNKASSVYQINNMWCLISY